VSDSSRQFSGGAEPLRDFGFGKGQEDFSKTGGFEFATAKFDDTAWRSLDLPHDWTVEFRSATHSAVHRGHPRHRASAAGTGAGDTAHSE
jgi:hypothetical protein